MQSRERPSPSPGTAERRLRQNPVTCLTSNLSSARGAGHLSPQGAQTGCPVLSHTPTPLIFPHEAGGGQLHFTDDVTEARREEMPGIVS